MKNKLHWSFLKKQSYYSLCSLEQKVSDALAPVYCSEVHTISESKHILIKVIIFYLVHNFFG